jgi:hypothetical protein
MYVYMIGLTAPIDPLGQPVAAASWCAAHCYFELVCSQLTLSWYAASLQWLDGGTGGPKSCHATPLRTPIGQHWGRHRILWNAGGGGITAYNKAKTA